MRTITKECVAEIFDEWLKGKKRLTAEEVKALPEGSEVWIHNIHSRQEEHIILATVVQTDKSKRLMYLDDMGLPEFEVIRDGLLWAYTLD